MKPDLILVHGLYGASGANAAADIARVRSDRAEAFAASAERLGVLDYEWLDGSARTFANHMLRRARGTARPVDALEIIALDAAALRQCLAEETGRLGWQNMASCNHSGLDPERSFVLAGAPRQLVSGPAQGQRVVWFGQGQSQLSEAEFVEHYTAHHGPLVASHAGLTGIRRYRQVPNEATEFCAALRALGLGQAIPPPVFAELVMGRPPFDFASLRARRSAARAIKADEKRHIDFGRSMLLLT